MGIESLKNVFQEKGWHRFYFIGISGVGMRGLAKLLLAFGYEVAGSDIDPCQEVKLWAAQGLIRLSTKHQKENISTDYTVIYSSAIKSINPEYQGAVSLGSNILHRSELLSLITQHFKLAAVSGTHGKTTTSAMLSHILEQTGHHPSYCIGAARNGEIIANIGSGEWFVLEADESDQSFLRYNPQMVVITNINYDHMENYQADLKQYENSFLQFAQQPNASEVLIATGSQGVENISNRLPDHTSYIGMNGNRIITRSSDQPGNSTIMLDGQQYQFKFPLAGVHMLNNALLAMSCALKMGVPAVDAIRALESFETTDRRFEISQLSNRIIVSDYGHHPTEVHASILTARELWPNHRLRMVFQPHRYSRLKYHFSKFVDVLGLVDQLILVPVYSSGELEDESYTSNSLAAQLKEIDVVLLQSVNEIKPLISAPSKTQEVIVFQGAGSIGHIYEDLKCAGSMSSVSKNMYL